MFRGFALLILLASVVPAHASPWTRGCTALTSLLNQWRVSPLVQDALTRAKTSADPDAFLTAFYKNEQALLSPKEVRVLAAHTQTSQTRDRLIANQLTYLRAEGPEAERAGQVPKLLRLAEDRMLRHGILREPLSEAQGALGLAPKAPLPAPYTASSFSWDILQGAWQVTMITGRTKKQMSADYVSEKLAELSLPALLAKANQRNGPGERNYVLARYADEKQTTLAVDDFISLAKTTSDSETRDRILRLAKPEKLTVPEAVKIALAASPSTSRKRLVTAYLRANAATLRHADYLNLAAAVQNRAGTGEVLAMMPRQNLTLPEMVQLATATPSVEARNTYLTQYARAHQTTLTPNEALTLAAATGSRETQNTIFKRVPLLGITVADALRLAGAANGSSSANELLVSYAKQNKATLSTDDFISLAKTISSHSTREEILQQKSLRGVPISEALRLVQASSYNSTQTDAVLRYAKQNASELKADDYAVLARAMSLSSAKVTLLTSFPLAGISVADALLIIEAAPYSSTRNEIAARYARQNASALRPSDALALTRAVSSTAVQDDILRLCPGLGISLADAVALSSAISRSGKNALLRSYVRQHPEWTLSDREQLTVIATDSDTRKALLKGPR